MRPEIRDAGLNDYPAWRDLWDRYCAFYETQLADDITRMTWARIVDPSASMSCRVACIDGGIVGFANYVLHPSTWTRTDSCYLEDLFVAESARGRGIGRALIDDLMKLGRASGWARLYWHTHAGNAAARRVYDPFSHADNFVRYRIALTQV
jgi:GNAT superfamily N-acetyltransferase